jgi:hypothetical protein
VKLLEFRPRESGAGDAGPAGAAGPAFLRLVAHDPDAWQWMPAYLTAVVEAAVAFGETPSSAKAWLPHAQAAFQISDDTYLLGVVIQQRKIMGHIFARLEIMDGRRTARIIQVVAARGTAAAAWRLGLDAVRSWATAMQAASITFHATNIDGRGAARVRRFAREFPNMKLKAHVMEVPWHTNDPERTARQPAPSPVSTDATAPARGTSTSQTRTSSPTSNDGSET